MALKRGFGEDLVASLNILDPAAGGVLVPANLSRETIKLLCAKTVVRKLGAAGDGINNKTQSWPLVFVGNEAYIATIAAFLDGHGECRSFLWTPPLVRRAATARPSMTLLSCVVACIRCQ